MASQQPQPERDSAQYYRYAHWELSYTVDESMGKGDALIMEPGLVSLPFQATYKEIEEMTADIGIADCLLPSDAPWQRIKDMPPEFPPELYALPRQDPDSCEVLIMRTPIDANGVGFDRFAGIATAYYLGEGYVVHQVVGISATAPCALRAERFESWSCNGLSLASCKTVDRPVLPDPAIAMSRIARRMVLATR